MPSVPKPADLFIGIAEFFGSFFPGTVLVALLWRLGTIPGFDEADQTFAGFEGAAQVTAILVSGYLAGNLVSVIGSSLDSSYDAFRKLRYPFSTDRAFQEAKKLKESTLGSAAEAMNVFQWSKAYLAVTNDVAHAEVARHEASSKLFRSMVVVSVVMALASAVESRLDEALIAVAAAVLSYWPYVDRRYKSTETAYRMVIVVNAKDRAAGITPRGDVAGDVKGGATS